MRGPASWSVACRKPDETIAVEKHELPKFAERHPLFKRPMLRGVLVLGESLAIGIKALMISANHALEEEEQLSDKQLGWTLTIAMVMFSAIFIALPVLGTRALERWVIGDLSETNPLLFNLIEGAFRIGIFVGYLLIISFFKDIRRVFQYHGAEHKTIYAYENGDELIPAEIDANYPTLHVRCGTNFLFIVLFLTIVAHFVIDLVVGGPLVAASWDPDRRDTGAGRFLVRSHQARIPQREVVVLPYLDAAGACAAKDHDQTSFARSDRGGDRSDGSGRGRRRQGRRNGPFRPRFLRLGT